MGCISSSSTHTLNSTSKEIRVRTNLTSRLIAHIQQGNLKKLKTVVNDYGGIACIDFTAV